MTNKAPITNPRADNVLAFEQDMKEVDKQIAKEREGKANAFDSLYADYLEARAKLLRGPLSDSAIDKLDGEADVLMWKIIHMPAPTSRHVDFKFEIMRGLVEEPGRDGRARAMLESIRDDVVEG